VPSFGDDEDDEAEDDAVVVASAGDAAAAIYYGQSTSAAKNAGAPAFIRGKRGSAVAPSGFPSRGYSLTDAALRVAASDARNLVDVDDAGDEAELVDYWTDEVGAIGRGRLAALGAKIVPGEEGEQEVVIREVWGRAACSLGRRWRWAGGAPSC
jgi:hypothetical protein